MSVPRGFEVADIDGYEDPFRKSSIRIKAHQALDQMFNLIESGETDGGAAEISNGEKTYRLIFADFTGEKDCPWCNGTGADGS